MLNLSPVTNAPEMLSHVRLYAPPALPPREPRFIRPPSELAMLAGVWDGTMPAGQWAVEKKHDGIRAIAYEGQVFTREGNVIHAAAHILPELARLQTRYGGPVAIDGEFVAGSFLETLATHRGKREGVGVLHVFDAIPLHQWKADNCPLPLIERQRLLRIAMADMGARYLQMVERVATANAAQVEAMAARIWAEGGEGIIAKDQASLYRRARSNAWRKLKRNLSLTGRVVEVVSEGAAARVEIGGAVHKVAVSPALRGTLSMGICVTVQAMEYSATGKLRQPLATAMGETA